MRDASFVYFRPVPQTASEPIVVEMLSMKFLRAFMPQPVFSELLNHVTVIRQRVGGDRLVLTGHSLGGAMAAMVGVSFSGPGLLY